ncbi:hypothetical protein LG329_17965 [Virgibacillus necropolis]|uniref:hypothetical protein n=1 Tax=Virgibacillus necropolis TaxID=163877 RepID=UPI00384D5F95
MHMKNFILHGNILIVEVKLNDTDYIIDVQWKEPREPYEETWELKSYSNKSTGAKDLPKEKIDEFLEAINAKWNWHIE